ncbi:related to Mig1 protein [Sporisorium reilianum f. sp. reilianum]|uniref:Related to Mig1 protein n=1 Tax=Sporisorium reilianum f. sp. reilianum TaxID=72559 RepID=A0A2N8UFG0_9BASI|nr:related to Mig1 protein [Sporisorium reilianum f. sp. reilianum]
MSTRHRASVPLVFALTLALLGQLVLIVARNNDSVVCSYKPPMLPRNDDFRYHCENTFSDFDLHWPCFSHKQGSLQDADILPPIKGKEYVNDDILLAKNADLVDFTPRNASEKFSIHYQHEGHTLTFFPQDDTKCFFVLVERWDSFSRYKLVVTPQDDTWTRADSGSANRSAVYICTKWTHIWVEKWF